MILDNGIRIYNYGDKNNKSLVFVHGFIYDILMWEKQIEYFSESYYCTGYDVRGLGKSEVGDGQYTMELFVEDLMNVIRCSEIEKPVLIGLSMGGYISFRALEKHSDMFSAAILLDTRASADSNEAKLKRANSIKTINENGLKEFVDGFIPTCFSDRFKSENRVEYEDFVNRAKKSNPVGAKGCQLAMVSRGDSEYFLHQMSIPVLFLCGEEDKLTPVEEMTELARKTNGSKLVVVPNSGHMTPIENPDFVNKQIQDFLSEIGY